MMANEILAKKWKERFARRHNILLMLSTSLLLLVALYLLTAFGHPQSVAAQDEPDGARQNQGTAQAAISEALQTKLANSQDAVSFLVILRDQVDASAMVSSNQLQAASRTTKAERIYHELTTTARRSQAPLRALLDARGVNYRAFYLVNMIEVEGDLALAELLQTRSEVDRLVANPTVANALETESIMSAAAWAKTLAAVATERVEATLARPYGLDYTNAPDVWARGYTGQGIVVASQDTGVEWEHAALKARYRGLSTDTLTTTPGVAVDAGLAIAARKSSTETVDHVYNWFDAWGIDGRPTRCAQDAQVPCDDHGHGTHTVGTMLGDATTQGDTVIGMAPDAEWIGCRNMRLGVGTPASYTACFEFFLAPFPQGGDPFTDGRPDLAPHIINNSWGCPPSEGCDPTSLRQVVETVRAAGQMVVASAGNDGFAGCSSVSNPISMHDATFSIGAHNSGGLIASFSSRGPVTVDGSGRLKPDISAPGVSVISAALGGGLSSSSGTSMASPHVAGATALLWSAVPELIGNIDLTEQVLIKSATAVPANDCGEGVTAVVPNNTYGYGQLDILAAVELAQTPVSLTVQVVDDQENPEVDQVVMVTDQATGYTYESTTAFNGLARISPIYPGSYVVTVGIESSQPFSLTSEARQQVQLNVSTTVSTNIYLPFVTR